MNTDEHRKEQTTNADEHRQAPKTNADEHRHAQMNTDTHRWTQTSTDKHRQRTQTSTDEPRRRTQMSTDEHRQVQTTSTDEHRRAQMNTDEHRWTQTSTDKYLYIYTCIYKCIRLIPIKIVRILPCSRCKSENVNWISLKAVLLCNNYLFSCAFCGVHLNANICCRTYNKKMGRCAKCDILTRIFSRPW